MQDGCAGRTVKFWSRQRQVQPAGLAQLVERWSHNPKVVSSILTPGNFAWMNSEGSGLGLQIQGGLTSQWFKSTFCAYVGILLVEDLVSKAHGRKKDGCSMRGSNPRPLAHKTNTLPTELMEHVYPSTFPTSLPFIESRVRGLVVMIVACQVMDPGSIPGERNFFSFIRLRCLVGSCQCQSLVTPALSVYSLIRSWRH